MSTETTGDTHVNDVIRQARQEAADRLKAWTAVCVLERLGYTYDGRVLWRSPDGKVHTP